MTFAKWVKIILKNPVIKDKIETDELIYTVGKSFDKNFGKINQIHINGHQIIISCNSPENNETISVGIPLNSNVLKYYYGKNSMKIS
jgi:preprotein translocase subunit SecA